MMLSPKQKRFVTEYLFDQNAKQAAIRAGYSAKTAETQGPRLYRKVQVNQAIQALLKRVEERAELSGTEVIKSLHRMASADIRLAYNQDGTPKPIHEIPDDVASLIAAIEVDGNGDVTHIRFADRVRPWEMLGKHFAVFRDVHELTGKNGGPIQTQTNAIDFSKIDNETLLKIAGMNGNGQHINGK